MRMLRMDHTGVFEDVVMPSMGKNAPALKIDNENAGTMRGQRNRDASARRVTRYDEDLQRGFFCETIGVVSK